MFAKTLIAAAALTAITAGMASTAEAKVHFDVNIGVPGIYVGPGYGYYPAYYDDDYYGGDCFTKQVKGGAVSDKFDALAASGIPVVVTILPDGLDPFAAVAAAYPGVRLDRKSVV